MTSSRPESRFFHRGWLECEAGAIRGTPFLGSTPIPPAEAVRQAAVAVAEGEFVECVSKWNGFFAVVVWSAGRVGVAVDRARSIPLFFSLGCSPIAVSDSAEWVREHLGNPALDPVSVAEFRLAGFVLNDATLCPGVRQVQSGEALVAPFGRVADPRPLEATRYRVFRPAGGPAASCEELFQQYDEILTRCFRRALTAADGRQIVVPLSGGYDSRLLLLMLVRMGARRLCAYTYGQTSGEVERSRAVAEAAGVQWHHCDYSPAAWCEAAFGQDFWWYLRQAGNLTAVPCIQEWLAVREFTQGGKIDHDAVFMPGYAADLPAGSFLTALGHEGRRALTSRGVFERLLWRDRLANWDVRRLSSVERREVAVSLARSVESAGSQQGWPSAYDTWMFSEQVPKFTVNALRAVDVQGYDWWLPYFDEEFLAFWEQVPDQYRIGERLHCDFTDDLFRRITGAEPPPREIKAKYGQPAANAMRLKLHRGVVQFLRAVYRSRAASWYRARRERSLWGRLYVDDPMGWYGLFSEKEYLEMAARGASGINAMLAETYLRIVEP